MKNFEKITKEICIEYHQFMAGWYEATLVEYAEAREVIETLLDQMGLDKAVLKSLPENWSFALGKQIFLGYTIGQGDSKATWLKQMGIVTHETIHVEQQKGAPVLSIVQYAADEVTRANREYYGYEGTVDMHWWGFGKPKDLRGIEQMLRKFYCLQAPNVQTAIAHLDACNHMWGRLGRPINAVSRVGIEWLEQRLQTV